MPLAAPPSARSTISGSRTATSASKSPSWTAARNASTTRRCFRRSALRSAPGPGPVGARGSRAGAWRRPSDPRWARSPRRSSQTRRGARTPVVPPAPASRGRRAAPDRQSRRGWHRSRALRPHDRSREHDRIRHVHVQGILPARRSRSQHVQAHARHDRRQPSPQVVDTTDIRAAESDPGFLDGVLRLADRSEHAIRDRPHVRSVRFELPGEPLRCGHRSHSSSAVRHCTDGRDVADVTGPASSRGVKLFRFEELAKMPECPWRLGLSVFVLSNRGRPTTGGSTGRSVHVASIACQVVRLRHHSYDWAYRRPRTVDRHVSLAAAAGTAMW